MAEIKRVTGDAFNAHAMTHVTRFSGIEIPVNRQLDRLGDACDAFLRNQKDLRSGDAMTRFLGSSLMRAHKPSYGSRVTRSPR